MVAYVDEGPVGLERDGGVQPSVMVVHPHGGRIALGHRIHCDVLVASVLSVTDPQASLGTERDAARPHELSRALAFSADAPHNASALVVDPDDMLLGVAHEDLTAGALRDPGDHPERILVRPIQDADLQAGVPHHVRGLGKRRALTTRAGQEGRRCRDQGLLQVLLLTGPTGCGRRTPLPPRLTSPHLVDRYGLHIEAIRLNGDRPAVRQEADGEGKVR